jgi:hypothetical protein
MDPQALHYRDQNLGRLSSHPYWLERGSRTLRWGAVGALILLYLLITWIWLRSHAGSEFISALINWFEGAGGGIAMGITAFAMGALAASSFQLRWAMRRYRDQDLATLTDEPASVSTPLVALVVVVGFALPLALTLLPGLPFEARILGPLLALSPVAVLSFLMSSPNDPLPRFPWVSTLLALSLWGLTFSLQLLDWIHIQVVPWVGLLLPALQTPQGLRSALMLLATPLTVIALFLLVRWSWLRFVSRDSQDPSLESPATTIEQDPDKAIDPFLQIAQALGLPSAQALDISPAGDETVEWHVSSEFEAFFEGRRLTQDQHRLLADFFFLSEAHCAPGREHAEASISMDMVVEGPSGSGRSSTLDAIALSSVMLRGERILMLMPDEGRVDLALSRLNRKVDALHLAGFVVPGRLHDLLQGGEATPDICITTPLQWEQQLVGSLGAEDGSERHEGDETPARAPAFPVDTTGRLTHYTVVLVDDFLDHPLPISLHLPFIVDKHRLLLESRLIPSVRVFAFPRLSKGGRELVVNRLIGDRAILDEARQIARLRYRPDLKARVLDVGSDRVAEVVEEVALAICKIGRSSVLMRHGLDAGEAARQTEDLRARTQNADITVCYCHDQLQSLVGEVSAIVMKAADGPDAVFAIRSHRPEEPFVLVRVRDSRELLAPSAVTPLIVDRSARGMAEAHLQSILRFIEPRTPIALRAWGQLGLEGAMPQSDVDTDDRTSIGSLLVDRTDLLSEMQARDRPYLSRLGSFMALDRRFERYVPVDCQLIPDPGPAWRFRDLDTAFGPGRLELPPLPPEGTARRTVVLWKGNDGAELGRTQIHYTDELLLRRQQVFCADVIRNNPSRGLEVRSMRFRDNGLDGIHPKFEYSWRMVDPEVVATTACSLEEQRPVFSAGGPRHGYQWIDFVAPQGCEVRGRLVQLADDLNRPTPLSDFAFGFQATLRMLLLMPSEATINRSREASDAVHDLLRSDQEWGTSHPQFLSGLTYAMDRVLTDELTPSGIFGRIMVFRCEGTMDQFAKALVWFVEPLGTGQTLSGAIRELLRGTDRLRDLAVRMDQIMAQGWDKSPLLDLSRFWLSDRKRLPISPFERSLFSSLIGEKNRAYSEESKPPLSEEKNRSRGHHQAPVSAGSVA